ncbi:MAG TPA: hypothetical protein DIT04_04970 [Dysgonomonas sp.]|nr:hypothetical protein [Dysgonomonas sp.]
MNKYMISSYSHTLVKKLLLLVLLTFGILSGNAKTEQKTAVLNLKSTIVGMTKNSAGTIGRQMAGSEFFIGYDVSKLSWGRGYLEFDLSSIPKNAKIKGVGVQLTSASRYNDNFDGNVRLFAFGPIHEYPDMMHWDNFSTTKNNASTLLKNQKFQSQADCPFLATNVQSSFFMTYVASHFGKDRMGIGLALVNESKTMWLSSSQRECYLQILYEIEVPDQPDPGENPGGENPGGEDTEIDDKNFYKAKFSGPLHLRSGEEAIYSFHIDRKYVSMKEWSYDTRYFTKLPNPAGYDKRSALFKAKSVQNPLTAKIYVRGYNGELRQKEISIYPEGYCYTNYIKGKKITSSDTYSGCIVEIENTTLTNNVKVNIIGEEYVLIKAPFTATAGTDVTIKIGSSTLRSVTSTDIENEIVSLEQTVDIYPNPVTDVLYLNQKAESVQMYNTNGRLVKTAKNVSQIEVSDLSAGLYIVKITVNSKTTSHKVMKK